MALGAGQAMAQKKTLAVVVKGLDNGFFTVMGKGCADWNAANPDSEYECLYTGPALTSDEAGEIQIVADLIARDDVAGIAISPSNAPAMAKLLTEQADDDQVEEDRDHDDRRRPAAGGSGPAHDLFRHPQLRHGRRVLRVAEEAVSRTAARLR